MRKDWIEVELGTVCNFIGGGTPSKSNPEYWVGKIPWASIKDLKGSFLIRTEDSISEEGLKNSASNLASEGDIILATRINPGRPIISKINVAINQDLKIVRPLIEFSPRFLFYLFKEIEPMVLKLSSGTTVLGINLTNLKSIVVPIPPLPEQRAIVARIEELFSELDHAVSSLQSAQAKLDIYRQAVLKKAFEIEDCKYLKLRNITSKIGSGSTPQGGRENYKSDGIPLVRSLNIHFRFIKFEDLAFIDEDQAKKLDNVIIEEGDVLLNITGASIGRVNIAPKEFKGGRVNQHVSIIRPFTSFSSLFIKYFLESPQVQGVINSENYGVTRQALTKSMIEYFDIPDLNLKEQTQIVQEIESRLSVADKLAETIQTNLQKSEALRQSILKKAFEGRLLSEAEVEACRKEVDWEPAEGLLARIERSRNERIKQEKSKSKKS